MAPTAPQCDSETVSALSLHTKRQTLWRLDVLPFALLHATVLANVFTSSVESESVLPGVSQYHFALSCLFLAALVHILAHLSTHWSINAECLVAYRSAASVSDATFVCVRNIPHRGRPAVVPLVRAAPPSISAGTTSSDESVDAATLNAPIYMFEHQKCVFKYDAARNMFLKPVFPLSEKLSHYMQSTGLDEKQYILAQSKWGLNKFDIPLPTFLELYVEQATAPFFVFQIFCVCLWLFDEYWYYSIVTLVMLLIFEGTVVRSRLRNLGTLRAMAQQPPRSVVVLRNRKWMQIPATGLVPGDLISISREKKERQIGVDGEVIKPNDTLVPCDCVLLQGTCVVNEAMLTGESTPKLKESLAEQNPGAKDDASRFDERLDLVKMRRAVVFSGTSIVQTTPPEGRLCPPDGGALAYVLRTGFETSQGQLLRTILFGTERMTANSREAMQFILVLVCFAVAASSYVLKMGLEDPDRSRYKLFLNCTMIITSVIPPELPMELTLAVNTSLLNLSRDGIFCTEPYRIPMAGKIDTCCFDKTGTLTKSNLRMLGVACAPEAKLRPIDEETGKPVEEPDETPKDLVLPVDLNPSSFSAAIVAGCHSLALLENELIGDPLEAAALAATGWELASVGSGSAIVHKETGLQIKVLARHHFSSALKRMSTVVEIPGSKKGKSRYVALVKGAPEVIGAMLRTKPDGFDEAYKHHSLLGRRVLALAYRVLDVKNGARVRAMPRTSVESSLTFAGLLVFASPVKKDAKETMLALRSSGHNLVMITGDATLTAAAVARDLELVTDDVLILRDKQWYTVSGEAKGAFDQFKQLRAAPYALCVPGDQLEQVYAMGEQVARDVVPEVAVFARSSPAHKERILATLKDAGRVTMMCGDGTNDVGALKQAHVGVAMLNRGAPPKLKRVRIGDLKGEARKAAEDKLRARRAERRRKLGNSAFETARERRLRKLQEQLDANEPPPPALGDASIASSFTSKWSNVSPIANVVRQGRCTLVTTLQMYKILAVNCLVTAYSLSVLYMRGVRLGDFQMTISGALVAFCFLFVSRAKPLDELAPQRPQPHVFSPYAVFSVVGQMALHLYSLRAAVSLAEPYVSEADNFAASGAETEDNVFQPTVLNSVVFLMSTSMQVANFAVNYRGKPFMMSLTDNKPLFYALLAVIFIVYFCASEFSPDFNDAFEVVPFPDLAFRKSLVKTMIVDFFGAVVIEQIARRIFVS